VLECSSVALGPWAAQQLGDLGADVIKIEPPEGDTTRYLGPTRSPRMAAFFLGCNRNKRSIVLDLKQEAGRAALNRLAQNADILIHNFRPGPAARLGLDYETLKQVNPRLICAATYGYRADGPMGPRAAYDDIIQAGCGIAAMQGRVGGEPRFFPTIAADKSTSNAVVIAVLAALVERGSSGLGQAIEIPMYETMISYLLVEHLFGETFRPNMGTAGYKRILNAERRPYATKDGHLALLPYTDAHWQEFCRLVERPDLGADERFGSVKARLDNVEEYYAALGEIAATRTNAEWLALLESSDVPHGPVNSVEDLLKDEQLAATGFWKEVDHPSEGPMRMTDIPQRFSRTAPEIRRLQPLLGEHSAEILAEAGYDGDEIDALAEAGVTKI
jgi:crotonobetainyl-CoA:carnitine CoA-transferase CaiB-like acyl-CoA transferase